MQTAFDHIARKYDDEFVFSETGKYQRSRVRNYLDQILADAPVRRILELNCGTGEDALWLAARGHIVLATDLSEEMIRISRQKAKDRELQGQVMFEVMDMVDAGKQLSGQKFDFVFSNFGGMNCLPEHQLKSVLTNIASLLAMEGRLITVIMSRFCAWETIYYMSKLQLAQSFRRRKRGGRLVKIGQEEVGTWYYSPGDLINMAGDNFHTLQIHPVGLFLPPSYLDPFFSNYHGLLMNLSRMEEKWGKGKFAASCADHYLIDLELST